MEPTQLVIIVISLTLATLFVILGIQVYHILGEMRTSLRKVNKMLDDMGRVSGTVGDTVSNVGGFVSGLKAGLSAIATLRGKGGTDE
jgi:hypothetical protein